MPPSAAEFSLDGDLFFMISLREIMKNKSPSKDYLARSAKKNLFTQPQNTIRRDAPGCTKKSFMVLRAKLSFERQYGVV